MAMYMAIPGSDYDKICWIKANSIKQASEIMKEDIGFTDEEMAWGEYRIFEIPSSNKFNKLETNIIARVSNSTKMFMYDDYLYQ